MNTANAFARGLRASLAPRSLGALGYLWLLSALVAAAAATTVFAFVSSTVGASATASDLRAGMTTDWLVDVAGTEGAGAAVSTIFVAALALAPLYLLASVFLSGGAVWSVWRSLRGANDRTGEPRFEGAADVDAPPAGADGFFAASGRALGPMFRLALLEILTLAVVCAAMLVARAVLGAVGAGAAGRWAWIGLFVLALGLAATPFDYARVRVVASGERAAHRALSGALGFAADNALAVVGLAVVNVVVGLLLTFAALVAHGAVDKSSGAGLLLAIVVGQASVLARLWTRLVAYGSDAALLDAHSRPEFSRN